MEFILTINPESDEPIIVLDDQIGYDFITGEGISGSQFGRELLTLDSLGKKKVKVYINSIGGSVMDGMTIFNSIISSKCSVDTYCVGVAASIAGVIFLAGKKRYVADYGLIMTHNPYSETGDEGEFLLRIRESLITMISARTGTSHDVISKWMDRETWMDCNEAIDCGFATDIVKSGEYNKLRVQPKETDIKSRYEECKLIMNKVFDIKNNNNNMELKEIKNEAELEMEDALVIDRPSNEVIDPKINNESDNDGDEMNKKGDLESLKAMYNELMAKYEDCNNSLITLQNEMEDSKKDRKKLEAEDMINSFIKMGKIKNETAIIDKCTKVA